VSASFDTTASHGLRLRTWFGGTGVRHLAIINIVMFMDQAAAEGDRWKRHDWWGVVLDCADVAELTHFYAELRGWKIRSLDDKDGCLDVGEGVAYLNIQHNRDFVRPSLPAKPGEQQMQLHLDFEVSDLAAETARAVVLGAALAEYQPQQNVRVLLDPAGHPFCLYTS
jgi:catechol 2,3-dioxygenase-like lactoylglutathione lyase family enzyme